LLMVAAVALALWLKQQSPSVAYKDLDTILAQFPGTTLVQPPDAAGPYRYIGYALSNPGEPVRGAFTARGKRREFSIPAVKDSSLLVVGLEPPEGGPTFAVLRRAVH